jgi:hypothetical protein
MKLFRYKNFESLFNWDRESEISVSELKSYVDDIMIDLKDDEFSYKLTINNWRKVPNDDDMVKWLNIEISLNDIFKISDIDGSIMLLINFLKTQNIYPAENSELLKLCFKNNSIKSDDDYRDIFKNPISKIPGTLKSYSYNLTLHQ